MTRGSLMALLLIIALSAGATLAAPTPEIEVPGGQACPTTGCTSPGGPYEGRGCKSEEECRHPHHG
ncbi:hypothetical protein PSHT_02080 [Puccinia striiformis]|nr:hypothetical protein KEM48_000880 [Puccinia striiformis f. sp. tritici PST-130]POV97327.1 hypothetical protein PSTT_15122 [Puccinia striiformis]POW21696.1 hypothetical protein PSHT_02080 [Puccinia striiformis]